MHELNVWPRRSGKTTKIIERFIGLPDEETKVILTLNERMKHHIRHEIISKNSVPNGRVLSVTSRDAQIFLDPSTWYPGDVGKKTIFADEYFFMAAEQRLLIKNFANSTQMKNVQVIAYSTSPQKISKTTMDVCRAIQLLNDLNRFSYATLLEKRLRDQIGDENFDFVYDSLLSIPNCKVDFKEIGDEVIYGMSKEKYEIEILGKCLID